jgi:hypothetical protein
VFAARSEAQRSAFGHRSVGGLLLALALTSTTPSRAEPPARPAEVATPAASSYTMEPPYDPAAHGGYSEGAWLRATRGTDRRSLGMMLTGIGFVVLGASMMIAGAVVGVDAEHCSPQTVTLPDGAQRNLCGAMAGRTTGTVIVTAGIVGLGLGIPLVVLGASDAPRVEAAQAGPRVPRATIELGLRHAAFALRF